MYLRELSIERFRSCEHTHVVFQRELTVLVGENNGGKSNILDAVRLLTKPLNGRRDRYAEEADLRRGTTAKSFEIAGTFDQLSDTLKGLLIAAVPDPTADLAILGCRYDRPTEHVSRGTFTTWVGASKTDPESGSTDLIRHVYLPALRDANQALGTGGAGRILALLRHFLSPDEEQAFVDELKRDENENQVLAKMNADIGAALVDLTGGVRKQSAQVNLDVETVQDIARDLRFKLGDAGLSLEDIRCSGLGYANLLYMATVAVELTKARDADLTLFLVEEPEAHLHPQLQRLVLEFLLQKARDSFEREVEPGRPEGRIQIVVSTHSPNLTAWAPPEHLVVVRSQSAEAEAGGAQQPETKALAIAQLGLAGDVLKKVARYLDVTRSALLFGNRTLLVEGIAEALLIPVIARQVVLRVDKDALARFNGALVVPIDGVDFRPYVEILLRHCNEVRVADRVVVVTDEDPGLEGNRRDDLLALATELEAAHNLQVFTNQMTLEYELFAAGNERALEAIFLQLKPRSAHRWAAAINAAPTEERPRRFVELVKETNVRKGDFAQALAAWIEGGQPFQVPPYLRDAIVAIAA